MVLTEKAITYKVSLMSCLKEEEGEEENIRLCLLPLWHWAMKSVNKKSVI